MTADQWANEITLAVGLAWIGNSEKLARLAQLLADCETAHEALVCAGVGSESDGLMDLVAIVVESQNREKETHGTGNARTL